MSRVSRPSSQSGRSIRHQNPLADDLIATGPVHTKAKKRKVKHTDDGDHGFVDSKSSRKILQIGQELADEDREANKSTPSNPAFTFESRSGNDEASDEEQYLPDEEAWEGAEGDLIEEVELDPNDLEVFNKYVPSNEDLIVPFDQGDKAKDGQAKNLADLILEQIAAHEAGQDGDPLIQGGGLPEDAIELPAKVVEVYSKIGLLLSRYKSGKLPKPFKIIPTMPQWEDLLALTRPDQWSPNACYEATKIFVSSKPFVVQRYLESVMLERVRDEIHETRKLNVHIYKALKKALYKPAAFFKGFLFPLVGSGTCTLREAQIISSVLARVSIPVLHSAAALMRLTDIAAEQVSASTEGGGATNIFIRILLEKKYALPYKVIDNLVFHFLRFRGSNTTKGADAMTDSTQLHMQEMKLPVLWHQSLLAFAQRYRNDITEDQREALLDLLLVRGHKDIGPEVRRELLEGRGRGVVVEEPGLNGGDDTMVLDAS